MRREGVFVIAEAGVNHNGSLPLALELVDIAAGAGADAVKFQTFKAASLASPTAPKAAYQMETTQASESQLEMLKKLELSAEAHERIAERCASKGIEFLSTPFDVESAEFLVRRMKVRALKISSGDLTNAQLLLHCARYRIPLIVSTGMGTLDDVEKALGVVAFGMAETNKAPGAKVFEAAYASSAGRAALREKVTLLHCTTAYPAPVEDVNLRAMRTLGEAFGLDVGYSDHTAGTEIAIAACALGARIIEKHFTTDRALPGPDHLASLEPDELARMVAAIRAVTSALGTGVKAPAPSEKGNVAAARKYLVALVPIKKGEILSESNVGVLRTGEGVSAMQYWDCLGKAAGRSYSRGEPIQP